jgi:peptide-methionine (S)-S-oxide reductase
MTDKHESRQLATLGGGCFWCIEAVFADLAGVHSLTSGYSGGRTVDPTYEQVCSGTTGHAEVVQISFDPEVISYADILRIFFTVHDPTTLNRQGGDVGTQYRSVIFYHDAEQKKDAESVIAELETQNTWPGPIVTEVTAFEHVFPAEDYHQRYFEQNPTQPYCAAVVAPKVAKFRKQFVSRLKK